VLPLPPKTGRFCTSAVRQPIRAEATAANVPASPPPTTTVSYSSNRFTSRLSPPSLTRVAASSDLSPGGWCSRSSVNRIASQRL